MDEWGWMESKRLVSHLQIYDTRQQEAKLHWLLLREFGHLGTYPLSGGMWWMEALHGTHMLEQQKTCLYGASYKTTIMILLHGLYEGEMREKQEFMLFWLHLGEYGKKFSHTFIIFLKRRKAHSWCKEATL